MPAEEQTDKQSRNGNQLVQVIGEIVLLLLQMLYYNLEALYRLFVPPAEKPVKGEVVLVTGAGHGIGKEVALKYAALGAIVIAWDINEKDNSETVKQIHNRGYKKAYGYVCDVSNREKVFETVKKVKKDVGDITIVINNAGIMPTHSLLDHTPDEIERIFKINVFAHFWILQAILPSMLKNNHGHVVSISSCAGIVGIENIVPYSGSKFAVRGYMEGLFHELRSNQTNCQIKLTTVCPYLVDTGLCKRPKVRFGGSMYMISPELVAQEVINAQRRDLREITIPAYYWYMVNVVKMSSTKFAIKLKDFLGVKLESDL